MTTTKSNIFFIILFVVMMTIFVACDNHLEHEVSEIETPEVPTETVSFTEDELLVLTQMRNPDNRICIDEATEIAIDAIDFFNTGVTTRSGEARRIANIAALRSEPIARKTTRSSGESVDINFPDTLAYVFNFADDAGFAIIAADTRIESPILAFVEDGSLDLNEEVDHPGLAIFLAGAEEYIERNIIEAEQRKGSLMIDILAKIEVIGMRDTIFHDNIATRSLDGYYEAGRSMLIAEAPKPWVMERQVGPLLPVEWGQGFPSNHLLKVCSGNNDGRVPAGCVATAVAMLMAYWKHPAQIDGYTFDWDLLNRFTARINMSENAYDNVRGKQRLPRFGDTLDNDQVLFRDNVARLMERIGSGVNMNYGCNGSGIINMQRMVDFFEKIGYRGGLFGISFSAEIVISQLNGSAPVIANGYRSKTVGISHNGHAWVIDGYLRRSQEIAVTVTTFIHMEPILRPGDLPKRGYTIATTTTHTRTQFSPYFLHNNWGWSGQGNGYFVEGSFHVGDRRYESNTRSNVPLEDRNYRYKNEIFTIRPRR